MSKFNKKILFSTLVAILGSSMFNNVFAENNVAQTSKEEIQIVENKKENNTDLVVYPKANFANSYRKMEDVFSVEDKAGFFTYEKYKEYREAKDPKREKNFLFNGGLINSEKMFMEEELIKDGLKKFINRSVEEDQKITDKEVKTLSFYSTLTGMTGFKLFNEIKDLNNTLFLFIDLNENPAETDEFLKNLYLTAKAKKQNVILFPLALKDENERQAYNFLKTMFLADPDFLFNLNERSFFSLFSVQTKEEVAMGIMDGIASNNILYLTKLGYVEPLSLIKIKDGEITSSVKLLNKNEIEEFIEK